MRPLILFSLALFCGSALAYKPETGHEPLTRLATDIYHQCHTTSPLTDIDDWQDRLVEGNRAMDEGLGLDLLDWWRLDHQGVFSLWRRTINWHFYHPDRREHSRALLVEQSLERLWNDLNTGFTRHQKPYHQLMFVGGLMHFLEDMTVPAHVVPIYHGPTLIQLVGPFQLKPLVDYMQHGHPDAEAMIVDAVDAYPVDTTRLTKAAEQENWCQDIASPSALNIRALLNDTARLTLNALETAIAECPTHQWHDFWRAPLSNDYFGRYAIGFAEQPNPLFGQAGQLTNEHGEVCALVKHDTRYHDFAYQRHRDAIKATLSLLAWAERRLQKP